MLLLGVKEYAARMGLDEIWMTTADHQTRRWDSLPSKTAYKIYAKTPKQMKFTLQETPQTDVEGVKSRLFWVHKVLPPFGGNQKRFGQIMTETQQTRLRRIGAMIKERHK
ncbi:MAG: hypothetical protein V1787_06495 [Candidatus Micrarchaeota archaeon]